ncbi:MAG: S-methyl-5'-thioadenosine phosphorylase [bacterium]|nr:S-methyl-5'-thioadenosine phosphorylase [bacterium]
MSTAKIGVIGGSGLYNIESMEGLREFEINTPFGKPSDKIITGNLDGVNFAFLPRHGKGHVLSPTEVNYRANIYALKSLGVEILVSVSAVGSLKEEHNLETLVLVDQFVDYTKHRKSTFFGDGVVAHVSFAKPTCQELSNILSKSANNLEIKVAEKGTYICMEGPQFSSKAESIVYRKLDFDVIGMTNATEAKLAKEAEMCYASMSFVTDYDCWHESEADVSVDLVLKTIKNNTEHAKIIIKKAVQEIAKMTECRCRNSLKNTIMTEPSEITDKVKSAKGLIIEKYL